MSMRRETFCCLLVNCVAVSVIVVILSLSLHSPQPVIFIEVGNIFPPSKPGPQQVVAANSRIPNNVVSDPTLASSHPHKSSLPLNITVASTHSPLETATSKQLTVKQPSNDPPSVSKLPSSELLPKTILKDVQHSKYNFLRKPLNANINKSLGSDQVMSDELKRFVRHAPKPVEASTESMTTPIGRYRLTRPALLENEPLLVESKSSLNARYPARENQAPAGGMVTENKMLLNLRRYGTAVEDTVGQFSVKHDVLPLVAFVDSRPRLSHRNATVILVQVRDVKRQRYNRIIGCGVDDTKALAFRVKPLFVYRNWIRANVPNLTHSEAVVTCYDLPSRNGSKAFVFYRPYRATSLLKVYSESPVYVPETVLPMKPWSVVVCTTVYEQPPWLSEWLRYQQTIGVDHIHLYAQQSFIEQGGVKNPELQKLLAAGRLTVDVRKAYLNSSEVYYYSQPLHYQDCLLRYRGVYEFAMLVDTDDFFVPRIPGKPDIHFYLSSLFPGKIGSVKLDWIRYYPSCGFTTPPNQVADGNLTHHLSTHKCVKEYVKSIHRLEYVSEVAIHEVTYLMPGCKKGVASNSTVYIAHIRKTDSCPDNNNHLEQSMVHYKNEADQLAQNQSFQNMYNVQ